MLCGMWVGDLDHISSLRNTAFLRSTVLAKVHSVIVSLPHDKDERVHVMPFTHPCFPPRLYSLASTTTLPSIYRARSTSWVPCSSIAELSASGLITAIIRSSDKRHSHCRRCAHAVPPIALCLRAACVQPRLNFYCNTDC